MEPAWAAQWQRQTVGIRELKQNPSEIIARAATGVRFDVLSNGTPMGVVIQRDSVVRSRWVTSAALAALSLGEPGESAGAGHPVLRSDTTGWAEELRAVKARESELATDPIVDPWDAGDEAPQ